MRPCSRFRRLFLTVCLALAVPGCMTVQFGVPPRVERLATLTPGKNTPADVLQTLGEPRGKGVARMTADLPPREIWFYEHLQSDGKAVDLKILLVFFHENRYDGHMWFASGPSLDSGYAKGAAK